MLPSVSIIIPTYNYAHYIGEAIESVLSQNYSAELIEIIVYDDGSTDDTAGVLAKYIKTGAVKYYYQQNGGKADATYQAIQKCTGKYIFNLDADDSFLTEKISETVKVFEADDTIVHVSAPAVMLDKQKSTDGVEEIPANIVDKAIDGNWLLNYFYTNNIIYGGGSTFAARASVLKQIDIPAGVDMYIDEFLLLTLFPYGKCYFINKPLSVWRIHTSNYSGTAATPEQITKKQTRLLNSSLAVLNYLQQHSFNPQLIKIYRVKHATRKIVFLESIGKKKIVDIIKYATDIFEQTPNLKIINKYNVMNRFIPSVLFNLLKKGKNILKA